MKTFINFLRAEMIKFKATPFFMIHILTPLGATIIFLVYYSFTHWDDKSKISAFYSVLGIAYPIVVSLITAIVTEQEYSAANYQNMLAVRNRKKLFAAKGFIMTVSGILSVMISSILFGMGNSMLL